MGPIPEDLLIFLLFAAFVVAQILRNWWRSKAPSAKAEPISATPADVEPLSDTDTAAPAQLPWTPAQVEGPRPKPAARAGQVLLPARPQARRFSRRMLMGDRRALQDAIVIATILGPCLAHRPRDTE